MPALRLWSPAAPVAPSPASRLPADVPGTTGTAISTASLAGLREIGNTLAPVATASHASASASVHQRYTWAQQQLAVPLGELLADMDDADPTLSRQDALLAVMRGTDAGDAQARTALALSVLPWARVAAAWSGGMEDPHAAELMLVVMLQTLFDATPEQGRALWPRVRTHGRALSLAQWVQALALPRHTRGGALCIDTLPAVDARLAAMTPVAGMDERDCMALLLPLLLPRWTPEQHAALAGLWRDDRHGWSLADAALRARELQDGTARTAEQTLDTLYDERAADRPPTCTGSVAEASVGLLHLLFGTDPAAFADGTLALAGVAPGADGHPVVQCRSALGTLARGVSPHGLVRQRLDEVANRTRLRFEKDRFYRAALRDRVEARLQQPCTTTGSYTREPTGVPPGPTTDTAPVFPQPRPQDPPGGLTDLGVPSPVLGVPHGGFRGVAAATLVPATISIDAGTPAPVTEPSFSSTPRVATAVTVAPPDEDTDLRDAQIDFIRAQLPDWIEKSPLTEQEKLQHLLDAQILRDELLEAYVASLESLYTHTGNLLTQGLRRVLPDHEVDPANITVTFTERTYPPPDIPGGFFELPRFPLPKGGVEPVLTEKTVPLVQFALDNAGPDWLLPPELAISAHGIDAGGRAVTLGRQELVTLVRDLDAGVVYRAYLTDRLTTSQGVRDAWVESVRAALRVAVQTARMSGTVFPRDFYTHLDPLQGYDFVSRMLSTVIDHPDATDRPLLETHPVQVMTLRIGFADDASACRVNGLWLVGATDPQRGITEVALIAPDLPGGQVIRVYGSLQEARSDPFWRTEEGYAWLKSHLSLEDQQALRVMTQRADPVKSIGPDTLAHFTASRMHFTPVDGHFLQQAYADVVETMLSDTDMLTTSTDESTWKASLSFAVDKALLLADLGLLPSLRVLGRVGRGLSALGRTAVRGRTAGGWRPPVRPAPPAKPPAVLLNRVEDVEPVRVKIDPPAHDPRIRVEHEVLLGAPPADGVADLQARMATLQLKERAGLSLREQSELRVLKEEVPRLKDELARQHTFAITANLAVWQGFMNSIPQLIGVSDAGARQYLAYLLSQREGSVMKVTKMLESLSQGVSRAPMPFRQLHQRGLTLIDDRVPPVPAHGNAHISGSQSLPTQGGPGSSKASGDVSLDGRRASDGAAGGSPTKKFAWSSPLGSPVLKRNSLGIPQSPVKQSKVSGGLTVKGQLPAPVPGAPYVELQREAWPKEMYHYTSRGSYDTIKGKGAEFLHPSNRNPLGLVNDGPPPRVVYATTLTPETGRTLLVTALFGRTRHAHDRTKKVACVIRIHPEKLPDGTRIIRYEGTDVWAIAAPGDGTIRLVDANGPNSVWTKPPPGGEIVPM